MDKPKIAFTPPPKTPLWGLIQDLTNPKKPKRRSKKPVVEPLGETT